MNPNQGTGDASSLQMRLFPGPSYVCRGLALPALPKRKKKKEKKVPGK
jgi:hypothetical protein